MNYSDLYNEGKATLQEADIMEAALDARLLLEYICGCDRNTLYSHPDMTVSEDDAERYRKAIDKRSKHVPLQHITGNQEFMGLDFKVTPDVLVPRQDTEFVVEEALKYIQDGMRVLDLCTGSGCIILSIMNFKNNIYGVATDISAKALDVAKQNAVKLGMNPLMLEGDLYEALEQDEDAGTCQFDVIISNPPYIRSEVIPSLSIEVKEHDPINALDGGDDGLVFYRRIIDDAYLHLTSYGRLFFEIGYDQADSVSKLLEDAGYSDIAVVNDYGGNPRVVTGKLIKSR